MKKTLILCMVFVLVASTFLVACGNESGSESSGANTEQNGQTPEQQDGEQVVLHTIGGPDPSGFEQKINDEFEKATGIKVIRDTVPYGQQQQKLLNSFMAKEAAYDVFVMDVIDVPQYVEAGWVANIDDYVTEDMKADLLPFAQAAVIYNDHWYGLPWLCEYKVFVYNKDLLNKAGIDHPPATWDEFVQQSQTLQQKGLVKYATAWSWLQGEALTCDFVAINATFGGEFFDDEGNPVFNKKPSVDALQFMIDTLYKYKISDPASLTWSESNVGDAMKAGDIAFELSWGLPLVQLNDPKLSKVVGQADIALIPAGTDDLHYTVSGPMAWSIAANTKHKEEAWQYINFRADKEGAKRAAVENGAVPGWSSLYEAADVVEALPGLDKQLEQAKYVANRPQVSWYREFSDVLQVELQNALTQKKTPQEALDDAVNSAKEIISQKSK